MNKALEDDFLSNYFNFGIVLRGSVEDISKLKEFISNEGYNMKVIYQRISTNNLIIREEKE